MSYEQEIIVELLYGN